MADLLQIRIRLYYRASSSQDIGRRPLRASPTTKYDMVPLQHLRHSREDAFVATSTRGQCDHSLDDIDRLCSRTAGEDADAGTRSERILHHRCDRYRRVAPCNVWRPGTGPIQPG